MSETREERRKIKSVAKDLLQRSQGFVLIAVDKDGSVRRCISTERLRDGNDHRHLAVRKMAEDAPKVVSWINGLHENSQKVEAVKAERSAIAASEE
jgi:hypothetical protein